MLSKARVGLIVLLVLMVCGAAASAATYTLTFGEDYYGGALFVNGEKQAEAVSADTKVESRARLIEVMVETDGKSTGPVKTVLAKDGDTLFEAPLYDFVIAEGFEDGLPEGWWAGWDKGGGEKRGWDVDSVICGVVEGDAYEGDGAIVFSNLPPGDSGAIWAVVQGPDFEVKPGQKLMAYAYCKLEDVAATWNTIGFELRDDEDNVIDRPNSGGNSGDQDWTLTTVISVMPENAAQARVRVDGHSVTNKALWDNIRVIIAE